MPQSNTRSQLLDAELIYFGIDVIKAIAVTLQQVNHLTNLQKLNYDDAFLLRNCIMPLSLIEKKPCSIHFIITAEREQVFYFFQLVFGIKIIKKKKLLLRFLASS